MTFQQENMSVSGADQGILPIDGSMRMNGHTHTQMVFTAVHHTQVE